MRESMGLNTQTNNAEFARQRGRGKGSVQVGKTSTRIKMRTETDQGLRQGSQQMNCDSAVFSEIPDAPGKTGFVLLGCALKNFLKSKGTTGRKT